MAATTTTLAPFQMPTGLPAREALAHAHTHIEKLQKKHESLKELRTTAEALAKKHMATVSETMFVTSAAAAMGFVNGRYGGEKGYVAAYGVPLDFAAAGVAHVVAFSNVLGDEASQALHCVGDAALAVGVYRWAHEKGVEHAVAVAAPVATNGIRPGTVYAVSPPPTR